MAKIDMTIRRKHPDLEISVGNVFCQIIGDISDIIRDHISDELSFFVQGYEFTKAFRTGFYNNKTKKWERWDGRKRLLTDSLKFNTGLLPRVKNILENQSVGFTITDTRKEVKFGKKIKTKGIEVRPYQEKILRVALEKKGGIISAATGSGKSISILQLVANINVKTMIYITGTDLLYQLKSVFEEMLGVEVGLIGDGQCTIKDINICTIWTAANVLGKKYVPADDEDRSRKEELKAKNKGKILKAIRGAELILFDECHCLSTQTAQIINKNSESAYYKYGLSGTPHRHDNSNLLIEGICGNIIVTVTATELIKSGYLVRPTIHFIDIPSMPGLSSNYQSIYKEYVVENEERNDKIISCAKKLVSAGRKVLILVKNINHGANLLEKLEKDFVIYFVRGNINSRQRNWVREEFEKNKIDIIISTVIFDQGINLPNLDALILAGSGKAPNRAIQRLGRVLRPYSGKKNAVVLDMYDNAKYLKDHAISRLNTYRTEPGFKIILPKKGNNSGKKKKKAQQLSNKNSW